MAPTPGKKNDSTKMPGGAVDVRARGAMRCVCVCAASCVCPFSFRSSLLVPVRASPVPSVVRGSFVVKFFSKAPRLVAQTKNTNPSEVGGRESPGWSCVSARVSNPKRAEDGAVRAGVGVEGNERAARGAASPALANASKVAQSEAARTERAREPRGSNRALPFFEQV